jgi:CubicO group peptidase (beta-lactamase class C family)
MNSPKACPLWRQHVSRQLISSIIAAALTLVFTGAAAGGLAWPDTRAAEIARGYIESFNSNDRDTLREFAAANRTEQALAKRSAEARAEGRLGMFAQIGALTPVLITEETPNSITITCRAEKIGMWMSMKVILQPEPPHKLEVVEMAPTSPPDMGAEKAASDSDWSTLAELIDAVRKDTGVPGIAAATIGGGKLTDAAASGVRAVGKSDAVTLNDRWHVGSVAKSMTATMIGALVESGALSWDQTIGDVLDNVDTHDSYRDVTILQLLQHRGGIQPYTMLDDEDEKRLAKLAGTASEQRLAFAAEVLQQDPVGPVGDFEYSNAGYTVVACMAERVTNSSWESLTKTHVFDPAGMKYAGFGWPAAPERPHEPRGHYAEGDGFRVQEFGEYELGAYLAPAGDVHMSVGDLAGFVIMHLRGLAGEDASLTSQTIRYLHTAPDDSGHTYACGWVIANSDEGTMHMHGGSAGTMFAQIMLFPDTQQAIIVVMNIGVEGTGIAQRIIEQIGERWKSEPQR